MEKTKKELLWEKLKDMKEGDIIDTVTISKETECSLAYTSSNLKYAFESGFIVFDPYGQYQIKHIPKKYKDFQEKINKVYNKRRTEYRKNAGSRPASQTKKRIPEDFEITQDNILPVIKEILQENSEMNKKIAILMKYVKKIKIERDDLIKTLSQTM